MSQVIGLAYDTAALTIYMEVRDATGQIFRGDTNVFEAYSTANLTNSKYASITGTEQGTASRYYTFVFPTAAAVVLGTYSMAFYNRLGANPAETDPLIAAGTVWWSGTAIEVPQSANIAAISIASGAGTLTTATGDSGTLTTGTNISGSYTDTFTDDNVYWITAPVAVPVGGFTLRQQMTFNLVLGRIPVGIYIRGWFQGGASRLVDIYALNSQTGLYDKITNATTAMLNRTTELAYSFTLPRDYADSSGGVNNIVTLEFRSVSTTTTDRLRLDQVLITHVAESVPTTSTSPTVPDIVAGILAAAQLTPIYSDARAVGGTTQTPGDLYVAISAIAVATGAGALTTKTADSATLITGTSISGTFTDTWSNDNVFWITAPTTAVAGFGLRQQFVFNLPLGRSPVSVFLRGNYTTGGTRFAEVYALNSNTGVFDQISTNNTHLANRTVEGAYSIPLPRDYADNSGGAFNVVTLELRITSSNTADRLNIDHLIVAHLPDDSPLNFVSPSVADIAAAILLTPGNLLATDALGGVIFADAGDFTATMKASITTAATASTPTAAAVTGNVGGNLVGNVLGTVPDSSGTTTLLARLTSARSGYLDNLNVGGPVMSHADGLALNQSASKHLLIQTVGQYELPTTGSTTYTVELRTFSATTGAAVNADSTPTIVPVGALSGNLSANLSGVSNPDTGVYRATYSVTSGATQEQLRFDGAATIATAPFTLSCYTQVVDVVSATWTTTDASNLTAIYNKLPVNNIADETLFEAAVASVLSDTDDIQTRLPAALVAGKMDSVALVTGPVTLDSAYDAAKTAAQAGAAMSLVNGAITETSFMVPADAAGPATGILARISHLYHFIFGKTIYDKVANTITTYLADGTTPRTTQTTSTSPAADEHDAAS